MTLQSQDCIIHNEMKYYFSDEFCSCKLFPGLEQLNIKLSNIMCTDCYRGYEAVYEIIDKQLYIVSVNNIDRWFNVKEHLYFTGTIKCSMGMMYSDLLTSEFIFNNGKLIKVKKNNRFKYSIRLKRSHTEEQNELIKRINKLCKGKIYFERQLLFLSNKRDYMIAKLSII